MATKPREPNETHYHIVVRDAELGRIRFGPITVTDLKKRYGAKFKLEQVVKDMQKHTTIEALLDDWEMDFGYTVLLVGDDGTNLELWEMEYGT